VNYVQQNFLSAVEVILSKLPNETLENQWATSLQNTLKAKKGKRNNKKNESTVVILRQNNENLQNILRNLVR
jgi:hypothetical protein